MGRARGPGGWSAAGAVAGGGGGVDADAEGGGEPGGLGSAEPAQPQLGLPGALLEVGDRGRQQVGVG